MVLLYLCDINAYRLLFELFMLKNHITFRIMQRYVLNCCVICVTIDSRKRDNPTRRKGVMGMSASQPIRDKNLLDAFKENLKVRGDKYYIMFVFGLNTGLRISDILPVKVGEIRGKDRLVLKEQKTGKTKNIAFSHNIMMELESYISRNKLNDDDYLIQSNKKNVDGTSRPIDRTQAHRVLKETGDKLGINDVATHTMRKTFGYWHYKEFKDVAILQEIFNHSAPSITLKYIGINQEEIDNSYRSFSL